MHRARRARSRVLVTTAAAAVLPFLPPEPRLLSLQHRANAVSGSNAPVAALRVAVDPVTRQKFLPEGGDVPPLAAPPRESLQGSAAGLTIVQRADGSKYVDLRGHFTCGIGVQVVDGRARQVCTDLLQARSKTERLRALETRTALGHAVEHEER